MKTNLDFETYLFVSKNKFLISVFLDSKEKIYENELVFENENTEIDFDKLNFFLEKNIFKIEKILKDFVNQVIIILDSDNFFPIELSIKKDDHKSIFDNYNLNYLLNEAKDCVQQTFGEKTIIHLLIKNYRIDDENYLNLPEKIKGDSFSIELRFICLSNKWIKNIEKILRKFHISLNQIVSGGYVNSFLNDNENDIFIMTKKILDGYNLNEVKLIEKTQRNKGFFEKFFNFFN